VISSLPSTCRRRVNQLLWWGEFIVRVTGVDSDGRVTSLQGGPVLGDGVFEQGELRNLGIGGRIKVFLNWTQHAKLPRWLSLLFWRYVCGECGKWSHSIPCPQCGCCSFNVRGIGSLWSTVYMFLYLIDVPPHNSLPFWRRAVKRLLPEWSKSPISNFGRWLWCNEWGHKR